MQDASHAARAAIEVTAPAHTLSATERDLYARDGFLALRNFVSRDCSANTTTSPLAIVQSAVDAVVADLDRVPRDCVFFETKGDPRTLKQIIGLHALSPALAELATLGPPAALAVALLGARVQLVNMQYFSKPPGRVLPTPPHQDSAYFLLADPSHAVTLWLALDDVDEENGAIEYVRGSHLGGLLPHVPTGVLGFSRGLADTAPVKGADNLVQRASPGDLFAHHGLTIHGAGANVSATRQRRALGFIYYAVEAVVDAEAKNAYEEHLRAHLLAQGRL